MTETIVHPVVFDVVNTYLRARPEVTGLVGARISRDMPPATASPRWPAVRITVLSAPEVIPRVWVRALVQIDCWATGQGQADHLAETVRAVLRGSANHTTTAAVMGETTDLATRPMPDTTLTPHQPRSIVTGHVWIRPN